MSVPVRRFPVLQVVRLQMVMAFINAHPEQWIQTQWRCGASHCFAGWGQIMAGATLADSTACVDARVYFGLTFVEAHTLFHPGNTLDELNRLVKTFTDPKFDREGYNNRSKNDRATLVLGSWAPYDEELWATGVHYARDIYGFTKRGSDWDGLNDINEVIDR